MPMGVKIVFGVALVVFVTMDLALVVTLMRPGDERSQLIVWKSSAYTLNVAVGVLMLHVAADLVCRQPLTLNPLIYLELIAVIYFIALLVFKRRHGN